MSNVSHHFFSQLNIVRFFFPGRYHVDKAAQLEYRSEYTTLCFPKLFIFVFLIHVST